MRRFNVLIFTLLTVTGLASAGQVSDAFTYQGELQDGGFLADGNYDMVFELYDAVIGGSPVVSSLALDDVNVVAGVFSVELDFGSAAFVGDQLWLEVSVREGSSTGDFQTLTPRQKITAAPYALHAEMVALDSIGGAEIADNTITGDDIAADSIGSSDIVDGIGSNLDADLLDGLNSTEFASQDDVSANESDIADLLSTVSNLQAQIDSLQNQPAPEPRILGVSAQSSTGRFTFNGKNGIQAANEMCKASYPSNPNAHFCDTSEVNRSIAADNFGAININNISTWSVFPNAESNGVSNNSLFNTCQGLLYNSGDVGNGITLTVNLNYFAAGGGATGDIVNIVPNVTCNTARPVMCCE